MSRETYRVNKARQDRLIDGFVDQLITPDSFIRDLSPERIIDVLRRLELEAVRDYQDILEKEESPPENYPDPAEMWKRSNHLGLYAWNHFRQHAREKFRLSLIELIHESLCFAETNYLQASSADEDEIINARPTAADIQHNVLRRSVVRMNQLPLKRESNDWHLVDLGENAPIQFRAARLIFQGLQLWTYDHSSLCLLVQDSIRPWLDGHENPDGEAALWGNEAAEIIWEHIDGAVQIMLLILTNWALLLSKQSAVKRYEAEIDPAEARQIQTSKETLKEIADELISKWVDQLPFDWRGPGRPAKTSSQMSSDSARLITELREIAQAITDTGDQLTWERLASGRKRPITNPQSGESLRKEAASLGIRLSDIRPEEN